MVKISFAKVVAVGIPFFILLYFLYLIVFNVPQIYTVDVGAEGDVDPSNDAYLRDLTNQERISLRMSIEDDTFRNMIGSPVYFDVNPKNRITNNTKILAELKFRGDSDLDIALHKDYVWKPLYIKNLDNYTPVKRFDDVVIYAKDNSNNYTNYGSINEWISGNILKYSSIGLYDYRMDPGILINRDLTYTNVETEINQTFRGTIFFLIYIKDSLNLTLDKQDLNWYNGSDEYSVELYGMDGSLLFNDTIPDDGIIDSSKQKALQSKTFFHGGISEGLYELRLVNLKGENNATDSTIIGIRINTDKIITQGDILPLTPGTLFFELKRNKILKFNIWHSDAVQNITIRGTINKDISITKDVLNSWVSVELPEGSYTMSIKGDIYISGANFAFTNDSLFQPYNYEINDESSDWIIITNYQTEKNIKDWIVAKKMFTGSELELLDNKTMLFGLRKKDKNEVEIDEFKVFLTPR